MSANRPARFGLSTRLLAVLAVGLATIGAIQVWYSERVLEAAMLTEVKHQALVFLLGVEREIQGLADPLDPAQLQPLLSRAAHYDADNLRFAILSLYLFDGRGDIIAREPPGPLAPKVLEGRYAQVLETGQPYLGGEIERNELGPNDQVTPSVDVIMPVHSAGGDLLGGLEVELDLGRTEAILRAVDDRYERQLGLMLLAAGGLLLGFVWLVIVRGLVRPVQHLAATTGRIADGDLKARVQRAGNDELGRLGQSVDRMADSIEQLFDAQEQAYLATLQSLAKALEAKDAYTASHSGRVARFSVMLGRHIGLGAEELQLLKQGALMHDLGKIGISDTILNKPSGLDDREYEVMKTHPELTYTIMRPLKRFRAFAEIARWHHERWDGHGYPDGLKGDDIPLLARIVAIADTWDAMTGDRVYREGMSVERALSILVTERDSGQWDPALLDAFVAMMREDLKIRAEVAQDMLEGGAVP